MKHLNLITYRGKKKVSFKIYKPVSFITFFLMSINSFSSSGIGWFDDDLDECFEAIEKGSYLSSGFGWSRFDTPYQTYPIKCRLRIENYFYDEKQFSLSRVILNNDNNSSCEKLIKSSYGFCEYAKYEDVKGVRPVP